MNAKPLAVPKPSHGFSTSLLDYLALMIIGLLAFSVSPTADAASARVSWDPVNEDSRVTGYEVHYGLESGSYDRSGTASGAATDNLIVADLEAGNTYFFAVRSRNHDDSIKSAFSDEVSITIGETGDESSAPTIGCVGETLWPSSATPEVASRDQTKAVELGVKFRADRDGYICGLRFYKGPDNTGTHLGSLWRADGTLLAQATFTNETATGWQQVDFAQPVAIAADTVYVASYHAPNGGWAYDRYYFAEHGHTNGSLTALSDGESGGNGPYLYGSGGFPTYSSRATNYWVDVVFTTEDPGDTSAEQPGDTSAPSVPASIAATATSASEIALTWAAATDNVGVTGYQLERCQGASCSDFGVISTTTGTAFNDRGLTAGTTYRYRVMAQDAANNLSDYSVAAATTLENTPEPIIGCVGETLWPISATPEVASRDQTKAVELGVKFRADRDGYICGLRFYKGPDNTGTHLGSLWRADGTLLAQAIFTNETATGWQQVDFAQPVAIAADTVYVASYHAPNGGWAYDRYYFAEHGYTNGSLTALRDGEAGVNGLYGYGSGGFPTYSSRATNYWVDVVFTAAAPDAGSAVLEYGEVAIDHEWHAVSFNREYADPVVIAQSLSANGSHPSVVRITDVDEYGFLIRVQEWDYLNQWHPTEKVGYLVMERGQHQLPDGTWVEAGYLETDTTDVFDAIQFREPFAQPPVVLTAVTSDWDGNAVTTRLDDVGVEGFRVGLQEQEAADQAHDTERVDYIAWEVSSGWLDNGLQYLVGRTPNEITDDWYRLSTSAFATEPVFLAGMQTRNDSDTAVLRWQNKQRWGVDVRVEEEESRDSETSHTTEAVGYFLIESAP